MTDSMFFDRIEAHSQVEHDRAECRRRVRREKARRKLMKVVGRTFGGIILLGAMLAVGMISGELYWIATIIALASAAFDYGRLQRDLF